MKIKYHESHDGLMDLIRIGIITGTTRPGRINWGVARWVYEVASKRKDATFELVDIKDYNLPILDEPERPTLHHYSQPHTLIWAEKIGSLDAFIFVTPEYNHGIPGSLKNAIDYLYKEWNNKAAGFVSYGSAFGSRAVEQLRLVMGELQVADVRAQVLLSLNADFKEHSVFIPSKRHDEKLNTVIDQVISWGTVLRVLR